MNSKIEQGEIQDEFSNNSIYSIMKGTKALSHILTHSMTPDNLILHSVVLRGKFR